MTLTGPGRFGEYERSRALIYVSQDVVKDSAFPFEHGDELRITIDSEKDQLIIERADES